MLQGTEESIALTPFGGRVDRVKRYGWEIRDKPGTFAMLPKNDLAISDEYQRELIPAKVQEIASSWSWMACGVILVASRDGKYWVFDGSHRFAAARKRSDIQALPCLIFSTETVREDATGFLACNTLRKAVKATSKHKAMVVAGDEVAIFVDGELRRVGVAICESGSAKVGELKAVALAYRLAVNDRDGFPIVLQVAADLARAEDTFIADRLLDGLAYLHRHVEGGVNGKRLNRRLFDVGAEGLLAGASRAAAFYTRGGSRVFGVGMLEAVNKKLHTKLSFRGEHSDE